MSNLGPHVSARPGQTATFTYVNWRGEEHGYVITVESFQFGPFDEDGTHENVAPWNKTWVLNGHLITRDGEEHHVGDRRTFMLNKIRNLEISP